jgi:adenosylcobinamide-GDP ribazoletransferase
MAHRFLSSAGGAVGFLTVLPASTKPEPGSLWWFPVVGGGIGGLVGLGWWGALQVWPPLVAAVIAVLLDAVLTGALHFDGLLDCADGLLAPVGKGPEARARRLVILKDVSVGSFGFLVGALVILAMVGAIAALGTRALLSDVLCFVGLWATSRTLVAFVMQVMPYARIPAGDPSVTATDAPGANPNGGTASIFLAPRRSLARAISEGVLGLSISAAALAWWRLPLGLVTGLVALLGGVGLLFLAKHRLGGYTGDVLGASCILVQVAGLLIAAGKW